MPSFNRCTFADSNLSPSTEWIKATVRVFWIPVLIFFYQHSSVINVLSRAISRNNCQLWLCCYLILWKLILPITQLVIFSLQDSRIVLLSALSAILLQYTSTWKTPGPQVSVIQWIQWRHKKSWPNDCQGLPNSYPWPKMSLKERVIYYEKMGGFTFSFFFVS